MANDFASLMPPAPTIRVLAQYTKAASFVSKDGIQVSGMPGSPSIDLGVDVSSDPIPGQDGAFETVLKLMARCHVEDDTMFELDLAYAGVFDVSAAPREQLEPILMIECPRLLFPFARRVIADISREGGFPPLLVDPVDFAALYQQQISGSQS